jgi:hypothetical protein
MKARTVAMIRGHAEGRGKGEVKVSRLDLLRVPSCLRSRHIRHCLPEGVQRNQRRVMYGLLTLV